MNIFRELWRNKTLVWKLGKNDFKTKYAGSYFGILWAFVQPMVTILIYIFIKLIFILRQYYTIIRINTSFTLAIYNYIP